MGTRSRIILKRKCKDIYLWLHWDGYFKGVGLSLIREIICLVYNQYSEKELIEYLEAIECYDDLNKIGEPSILNKKTSCYEPESIVRKTRMTDVSTFGDFFLGKVKYHEDSCDDIEYTYTIDFYKKYLIGDNGEERFEFNWNYIN